jgi:phosphate/sulfate permease
MYVLYVLLIWFLFAGVALIGGSYTFTIVIESIVYRERFSLKSLFVMFTTIALLIGLFMVMARPWTSIP